MLADYKRKRQEAEPRRRRSSPPPARRPSASPPTPRPSWTSSSPAAPRWPRQKIAQAEVQATAEVRAAAAEAAVKASEQILRKDVATSADALLAKGLAEVRTKLN